MFKRTNPKKKSSCTEMSACNDQMPNATCDIRDYSQGISSTALVEEKNCKTSPLSPNRDSVDSQIRRNNTGIETTPLRCNVATGLRQRRKQTNNSPTVEVSMPILRKDQLLEDSFFGSQDSTAWTENLTDDDSTSESPPLLEISHDASHSSNPPSPDTSIHMHKTVDNNEPHKISPSSIEKINFDDSDTWSTISSKSELSNHSDTDTSDQQKSVVRTSEPLVQSSGNTNMAEEHKLHQQVGKEKEQAESFSFAAFRVNYLIVHIAIMLADGLQGTHLYVLYEGYGYSVASLYCLGFVSGAITSPFTGPLVDRIGRKKAAMLYCFLEMIINYLEQYPIFLGLIVSRVVGGITTNLLFTVFESWLVTEHRKRGFAEEKLETILCDSVIASNMAAIFSGYLSHLLASKYGAVGPFEGAVACTGFALMLVGLMWAENYGSSSDNDTTFRQHMCGAFNTIVRDSKISRIGLIQGLSEGTLQTFVFLWSPALRSFAAKTPEQSVGMDENGDPAYGLIFSAFMACGVMGGVLEPRLRKYMAWLTGKGDMKEHGKAEGVEFLTALCYFTSAGLLFVPFVLDRFNHPHAFSISLIAFLIYEFLVGVYMPCEGVLRSLYMPNESICSLMTMLRVIVNIAVALGVISTNYVSFTTAFASISGMLTVAGCLQLSLVSKEQWLTFMGHAEDSANLNDSNVPQRLLTFVSF